MPDEKNEQIALSFFDAIGADDFTKAKDFMHENCIWRVMAREVPGEGTHTGADAIFNFIRPVRALFEKGSPVITLRNIISSGNKVIIETHGGGRLSDGRDYDNNYVMIIEVRDGKVTELREYMDSFYVHQLFN